MCTGLNIHFLSTVRLQWNAEMSKLLQKSIHFSPSLFVFVRSFLARAKHNRRERARHGVSVASVWPCGVRPWNAAGSDASAYASQENREPLSVDAGSGSAPTIKTEER